MVISIPEKIAQLKRTQANYVGDWEEYDSFGEVIEELEKEL